MDTPAAGSRPRPNRSAVRVAMLVDSGLAGLQAGDLCPGGSHQLLVGVGVAVEAPTSVWRLGQQHPGPAGQPRVTGGLGGDAGQLLDHGELLAAIERAGVGEDLDPYVVGVAV